MSVFTEIWFWILIIGIIFLIVAMVLVESYNVKNGTVTQTPNYVWFLFVIGVLLVIWSLVLISMKTRKEFLIRQECAEARACGLPVCEEICGPAPNPCEKFRCATEIPCPERKPEKTCEKPVERNCSNVIDRNAMHYNDRNMRSDGLATDNINFKTSETITTTYEKNPSMLERMVSKTSSPQNYQGRLNIPN